MSPEIVQILILVFGSGGFITGLASLLTVKSKASQTEMDSLRDTIDTLTAENKRLSGENMELRHRFDELERTSKEKLKKQDDALDILVDRVKALEKENNDLKRENAALRERLSELEKPGKAAGE